MFVSQFNREVEPVVNEFMDMRDYGPVYTETDLSSFPVEPLNTYSNILFLIVIIYWFYRRQNHLVQEKTRSLLTFGLPILLTGYIGGTVYHATRSHVLWLILDALPIAILVLYLAFKLWKRVIQSHWKILLYVSLLLIIPRLLIFLIVGRSNLGISLNYVGLTLPVLVPAIIFERQHHWKSGLWFIISILLVYIAVVFRILDGTDFVKHYFSGIGTHWLWHSFGAISSFFVLTYFDKSQKIIDTD